MKKCLVIVNRFKKNASELGEEICSFLKENSVGSDIYSYDSSSLACAKSSPNFCGYDFTITLGGDGTVLSACRGCAPLGIPVFPINLGEFGFLAVVSPLDWKRDLLDYIQGRAFTGSRSLVRSEVIRDGKTVFDVCGMNDAVISSPGSSRLVNLDVAYNHALLGPFKANGIIVSTPTGSTAYSAAAGGPILDPSLDGLVLTPVSSFSLSARPLVFSAKGEIAITVKPSRVEVGLSIDGQMNFTLQENDVIILGIPEYKASIICSTQEKFYAALQSKLNWSGGPRA
ncbi:MAG: NAD(+)/NADH kinase [Treponema sp.]|nr:NAD(+)/NADH kinase [Treponema sp.]